MKAHTTNYTDTFIEVAEDCPAAAGEMPPVKGEARSAANMQFDILIDKSYQYTSDDVLFQVYAQRNGLKKSELKVARNEFFSKGQPCLRASPLTKRYGWGVHSNKDGKVALYGRETPEYKAYAKDKQLKVVKAMRSKK